MPRATLAQLSRGRESALFAAAVIMPRLMGFLTVPIYTRLLGTADFGRYELMTSMIALMYALCLTGMDFAISVRYFNLDAPSRQRDAIAALAAAGATSVTAALVLGSLSAVVGPVLLQTDAGAVPFVITIAAVPFNVLGGVLAMCLRLQFRGRAFFASVVGGSITGTAAGIFMVLGLRLGLVGALLGLTLVHLATFTFMLTNLRRLIQWRRPKWDAVIALIRLGAPMIPAGTAVWVFAVADRFFVSAFLGFSQLGLYAAAARLGTILSVLQFGFHAAWGPVALRWGASVDRDAKYAASLRLVAVVGGATAAAVSWLAKPILWILAGPAYVAAANAVWLLAAGVLFSAMFFTVQIGASLAQHSRRVAYATIIAALVNTVANLVLIPPLGYLGAAWATLVAYVVAFLSMHFLSQRATPLRLRAGQATLWAIGWTLVASWSVVGPPDLQMVMLPIVLLACGVTSIWAILAATQTIAPVVPAPGNQREN